MTLPSTNSAEAAQFRLRRFGLFFLVSMALHAVLFGLLRSSPPALQTTATVLEVRFMASSEKKNDIQIHSPSERKRVMTKEIYRTKAPRRSEAKIQPMTSDLPTKNTSRSSAALLAPPTYPSIPIEALLESARRIAREDVYKHPPLHPESTRHQDQPILPQLARALRREPPGETRLSNGMIKVITITGAIYCLQPLPKFAQGGPVEPMIVPTNCPS